jgi:2-dehydro-3-deoxyphosphogluconate aldolase/(4S)-4-hydroxy-2-oxoglutarate aldolase
MRAREELVDLIQRERLIAILRASSADRIAPVIKALAKGGVRLVELSLAAPGALTALARAVTEHPDLVLGAGTVLDREAGERAVAAGARYLVAPNFDPAIETWARAQDVLYIPGAFSPSEVAQALSADIPLIKLFPAARLGPDYVRDLLAPFPYARLIPTGGITAQNARAFCDAGAVAIAVGTALAAMEAGPAKNTENARQFRALVG